MPLSLLNIIPISYSKGCSSVLDPAFVFCVVYFCLFIDFFKKSLVRKSALLIEFIDIISLLFPARLNTLFQTKISVWVDVKLVSARVNSHKAASSGVF